MEGAIYLGLPMKLHTKCLDCGVNIEIRAHPEDSDDNLFDRDIVAWYSELFGEDEGEGEDEDEDGDLMVMRLAFFGMSDVEYTCGCPKCGRDYPIFGEPVLDEEE